MSDDVLMALMDPGLLNELNEHQRDAVARRLGQEIERDPELKGRLQSLLAGATREILPAAAPQSGAR